MVSKERLSLAKQIIHCHAYNKRQENPVRLDVACLEEECETRDALKKMDGFPGGAVNQIRFFLFTETIF